MEQEFLSKVWHHFRMNYIRFILYFAIFFCQPVKWGKILPSVSVILIRIYVWNLLDFSSCLVSKKVKYTSIPFMSRNLDRSVHSDIEELARRFYPQINFSLSFKNSFTVNSFFLIQRPHFNLCTQQCSLFIHL